MDLIGLGIRLAIIAAVCAALYGIWRSIDNALEHHYADPVRAEFKAYKAAQDKQRADIILDYTAKLGKAHDDKVTSDLASVKRLAIIDGAVGNVVSSGAGIRLPADLVGVLNASASAANGRLALPDRGGQAKPDAIPATPEAASGVYDERELAQYLRDGAAAYDDAVGLWKSCRTREDACRDARSKGPE
jgi:hypothetical protein